MAGHRQARGKKRKEEGKKRKEESGGQSLVHSNDTFQKC
jgi:hypothetical protein